MNARNDLWGICAALALSVLAWACDPDALNRPQGSLAETPVEGRAELPLRIGAAPEGTKASVLGGVEADLVRLRSEKTGRFVEMGIRDFPFMTLWGQGQRMTVIAIEPWCGTSDLAGTGHRWERKFGNVVAYPGQTFQRSFYFRLG